MVYCAILQATHRALVAFQDSRAIARTGIGDARTWQVPAAAHLRDRLRHSALLSRVILHEPRARARVGVISVCARVSEGVSAWIMRMRVRVCVRAPSVVQCT